MVAHGHGCKSASALEFAQFTNVHAAARIAAVEGVTVSIPQSIPVATGVPGTSERRRPCIGRRAGIATANAATAPSSGVDAEIDAPKNCAHQLPAGCGSHQVRGTTVAERHGRLLEPCLSRGSRSEHLRGGPSKCFLAGYRRCVRNVVVHLFALRTGYQRVYFSPPESTDFRIKYALVWCARNL